MSDILYLINSYCSGSLPIDILRTLDDARIAFVRGDIGDALAAVDRTLDELDGSMPGYRDVIALRLFMGSVIGADSKRWMAEAADESVSGSDALTVAALCVESDEHWHSGSLLQGLSLNRAAVEHSHDVAPVWRVYAYLLFAKKLSDIHISLQAHRVVRDLDNLIDTTGLHVLGSLPEALRSVLHLQAGRFEQAIESASSAVRVSDEHHSAVGVKLALSVAATAHLARGDWDRAVTSLESFHTKVDHYALPDSVARAAFAETALIAAQEGPHAAAEQIRAKWHLLNTGSASLIEDPARPAWLIAVARRAGDTTLAERCLRAIERLANDNRGFTLLESAAQSARAAAAGEKPELTSLLDFGADRPPVVAAPHHPSPQPAPDPESLGASPARTRRRPDPESAARPTAGRDDQPRTAEAVARAGAADPAPPEPRPIASLSLRESEIARFVGRGMTNQQVAKQLDLSPHTVNFHLRNIFRKLSISTRVKLGPIVAQFDRPPDS
ncbi:LuxR C-terminal-related transcriptional regulator [Streptomyces sp. NPDC059999]|uniref:helix-turn-helix transcriptional regulator n=1 Tax=Streptomyces sp. NPDC059999 TaxID=3347030 RepID=UPI0036BF13F4